MSTRPYLKIASLVIASLVSKYLLLPLLSSELSDPLKIMIAILIVGLGAAYVITGTAKVIEETTEILHERTHLAGGLIQSLGTAFPDMVLGIVAATVSLSLKNTDYESAVNYAIIAASTTFGSNIYNIGHAAWCLSRQNLANVLGKSVLMFPYLPSGGKLKPIKEQKSRPSQKEFDTAISASVTLTILTAAVALGMVIFGKVSVIPSHMSGDLYQLIRPVGIALFFLALMVLLKFRKSERNITTTTDIERGENFYRHRSNIIVWSALVVSGLAILFAAESMIHAIEIISHVLHIPVVVSGVLSGLIGCLGEMTVVHNYSVHPNGRLGDAVIGVAMDNIVTILGASIVSIIGGVFLGGHSLILIFVIILMLNSILIGQMSALKNYL